MVTSGDTPLLTAATLAGLVARTPSERAAATVVTAVVDDPTGYGRVVRADDGGVAGDRRGQGRRPRPARARRDQQRGLRLRRRGPRGTRSRGSAPTTPRARSTSPTSWACCGPTGGSSAAFVARRPRRGARRQRPRPARRRRGAPARPASLDRLDAVAGSPSSTRPPPGWTSTSCSSPTSPCCRAPSCTARPRSPVRRPGRPRRDADATPSWARAPRWSAATSRAPRSGRARRSDRSPSCGPAPGSAPTVAIGAFVETKNAHHRRGLEGAAPVLRRRRRRSARAATSAPRRSS